MKRWLSRNSVKARLGMLFLAGFSCFAVLAAQQNGGVRDTELQRTDATQNAPAQVADINEKPNMAITKTEIITTEEEVPFVTMQTYDGTLAKDTTVVRVEGQKGKKIVRTEVKTKDGVEVSRALISEEITVPPVSKVVAVGTKVVGSSKKETRTDCNPNYKPCVPNVRQDLDCDDIEFQVEILGEDVYNFDEDDEDGIGCERFGSLSVTPQRTN